MIFLFPYIKQDFSLTYTEVGFLSMIMHISALACNVGSGPLVDMSGRRIIFLMLSLIGTGAALFLFGIAQSFLFICLLVSMVGAANNLWHAPGIAFLSETFPKNRGYVLAVHATGADEPKRGTFTSVVRVLDQSIAADKPKPFSLRTSLASLFRFFAQLGQALGVDCVSVPHRGPP